METLDERHERMRRRALDEAREFQSEVRGHYRTTQWFMALTTMTLEVKRLEDLLSEERKGEGYQAGYRAGVTAAATAFREMAQPAIDNAFAQAWNDAPTSTSSAACPR